MVTVPLKQSNLVCYCVETKIDFDKILNKTNSKFLVISISCYCQRKKSSLETDEAVCKINEKSVTGRKLSRKQFVQGSQLFKIAMINGELH